MKEQKIILLALGIIVLWAGLYFWGNYGQPQTAAAPKTALFTCAESKTITATFYPKDDKYVDLSLSDGRKLSVPRAISASGARYANTDESFVFWNKGDTAFIMEGNTTTFADCATNTQ